MPKCTASRFHVYCTLESLRSAAASSGISRSPSSALKLLFQSMSSHTSRRSRGRLHLHATWSTNATQGDCSSRPSWKPDVPMYIASRPPVLVPPLKSVAQSFTRPGPTGEKHRIGCGPASFKFSATVRWCATTTSWTRCVDKFDPGPSLPSCKVSCNKQRLIWMQGKKTTRLQCVNKLLTL